MKSLALYLVLGFLAALSAFGAETNSLASRIRAILPGKVWAVDDRGSSLVITGPEVRTLWPVNLPAESDEKLWREYSITNRVEVLIEFQAPISDEDVAQLKKLKEQFEKIMKRANHGIDHLGRDGDVHVRKFGFVRIPDYRSSSSSLFVSDNVGARRNSPLLVDPDAVRETVRKIYGVIEGYCKSDVDSVKKKTHSSGPEPAQ